MILIDFELRFQFPKLCPRLCQEGHRIQCHHVSIPVRGISLRHKCGRLLDHLLLRPLEPLDLQAVAHHQRVAILVFCSQFEVFLLKKLEPLRNFSEQFELLVARPKRSRFKRLLIRGMGKRPLIKAADKLIAERALWLVRGGQVTIENIEFRGARANDREGAGIRMEGGRLHLRKVALYDNENGVNAAADAQAELRIEDCEFGLAPRVVGGLHHLLNVGRIAKLHISGSRFQQGFEGQLIKTRARENLITYNLIHDGMRGGASYEIEVANGGLATLIGNVIGQGADTQNPVLVAYGTEKTGWDRNELVMAHNTFMSYGWTPAWFVRVIDKNLPPNTQVVAVNNLLVGLGLMWPALGGGTVQAEGNRHISRRVLRDHDTGGYELQPNALWRGSAMDPRSVGGRDLSPKGEFEWPVGVLPLAQVPAQWAPGAYQR